MILWRVDLMRYQNLIQRRLNNEQYNEGIICDREEGGGEGGEKNG